MAGPGSGAAPGLRRTGSARAATSRCRNSRADASGSPRRCAKPPAGIATAAGGGDCSRPKPSSELTGGSAMSAPAPATPCDRPTSRCSISTNRPDSGSDDHSGFAVVWISTSQPSSRLSAVTSGVPSDSRAQVRDDRSRLGSASTWRVTRTSSGMRQAGERAVGIEGRQGHRLRPGHGAAEGAPAAALRSGTGTRSSDAFGHARAGEAHHHAAALHPLLERRAVGLGQAADIGQDHHRDLALEDVLDVAVADLAERRQRALQIVGVAQQRLQLLERGAGHEADRAAAPALVEQDDACRRISRSRCRAAPRGCAARSARRCARWRCVRRRPSAAPRARSGGRPRRRRAGSRFPRRRRPGASPSRPDCRPRSAGGSSTRDRLCGGSAKNSTAPMRCRRSSSAKDRPSSMLSLR